jgi:hypothetical protein
VKNAARDPGEEGNSAEAAQLEATSYSKPGRKKRNTADSNGQPKPKQTKRAQVSKPETSAASASGAKVSVPVHTEESPQVPPTAGPTGEQAESDDAKPEPESNPAPKKRVRCKKPPATTDQVQAAWKLKETRGLCVFSLTNMGQ